ncbi:MAG: hypothetical protein ACKOWF_10525 [Chloroflexota bacterium]
MPWRGKREPDLLLLLPAAREAIGTASEADPSPGPDSPVLVEVHLGNIQEQIVLSRPGQR